MWNTIHAASDPLAWIAIGGFVLAIAFDWGGYRQRARYLASFAWAVFGLFWFAMFPYFYFDFQSPLESILSLAAVPLCLYAGWLIASGKHDLVLLSRAVGVMGLIYLPAMMYEPITQALIETVTVQTVWGMELLGYSPAIETGANGYESRFDMEPYTGDTYSTYIVLACTGIGSMAIFGGLIAATNASLQRKLLGIAAAVGIIWILNLARNVFVGLAAPLGWFDYPLLESITAILAGEGMRTSFFVAHHLIAQTLAVVALIGIALIIIKIVPEILAILDEALFIATGTEFDLMETIGPDRTRTAGGSDSSRRP